jgi:hypothetical protein
LLANGLVLMAGGENVNGISISKAELYNSATGAFAATDNMPSTRQEHAAALLPNGNVLVSGSGSRVTATATTVLATCAIYNPGTGAWTSATSLKNARVDHTSTVLSNGKVLDAGGENATNELINAELY